MIRSSCSLLLLVLIATVYTKDYFVEQFEGKNKLFFFKEIFSNDNLSIKTKVIQNDGFNQQLNQIWVNLNYHMVNFMAMLKKILVS